MEGFSDAGSFTIGSDNIPRFVCEGDSYRDKVKHGMSLDHYIESDEYMLETLDRLDQLHTKQEESYIFVRTDSSVSYITEQSHRKRKKKSKKKK